MVLCRGERRKDAALEATKDRNNRRKEGPAPRMEELGQNGKKECWDLPGTSDGGSLLKVVPESTFVFMQIQCLSIPFKVTKTKLSKHSSF